MRCPRECHRHAAAGALTVHRGGREIVERLPEIPPKTPWDQTPGKSTETEAREDWLQDVLGTLVSIPPHDNARPLRFLCRG